MYKQLNHSSHDAAYLLGGILLFPFKDAKKSLLPPKVYRALLTSSTSSRTKCATMRWVSGEKQDSGKR